MTAVAFPTRRELQERRRQLQERRRELRRRYRARYLKNCWRILVSASLLGGAIYGIRQPIWSVADVDGVDVAGNVLLSAERVRSYVETEFPQLLWQIEPRAIERQLESHALIRQARISRQLWPPSLAIEVEEHEPVARAKVDGVVGLVDREGVWVPLHNEAPIPANQAWQSLWVEGWEYHHPEDWADLLHAVQNNPVAISHIDWTTSSNLVLTTELGKVHLGSLPESAPNRTSDRPVTAYVAEKLQALDRMRNLAQHCECTSDDIDYIDLSNAETPSIALTASAASRRF